MTLQIELPIALEAELLARAAAEGKEVSSFVIEAVTERLAAAAEMPESRQTTVRSAAEFEQWLQAWADLHPRTGRPVDDSRESIYAGRGE